MDFNDFLGSQKGFICSYNGLVGAPMGVRKVQKRVSGASPVNIGPLDHNVVFGTKSGAVQDLQSIVAKSVFDSGNLFLRLNFPNI